MAGGFSRRMGEDKAHLDLGGLTLLEWVARRYAPPGTPVLVGTRDDGPGRGGPFPVALDLISGEGPLSSMAALLRDAQTPHVVIVPCDLPMLPPDFASRMVARCAPSQALLLEVEGHPQPFPVVLARDAASQVRGLFEGGERRALAVRDHLVSRCLPWEEHFPGISSTEAFLNVNDAESLARFLSLREL